MDTVTYTATILALGIGAGGVATIVLKGTWDWLRRAIDDIEGGMEDGQLVSIDVTRNGDEDDVSS